MIARCRQSGGDIAGFVAECLQAYQQRPTRAEPLHALAVHYRNERAHETAALFCEAGLGVPLPDDVLFVEEEIYHTGFRHELSISGFYCRTGGRRETARRYTSELAVERAAPPWVRENARANWKHFARGSRSFFPPRGSWPSTIRCPRDIGPAIPPWLFGKDLYGACYAR